MSENEWSDLEEDEIDHLPEEIIEELKYNSQIKIISNFKKHIIAEPEFVGIDNICSYNILLIINYTKELSDDNILTDYQVELFDDLYIALFNEPKTKPLYEKINEKLNKLMYV